MKARKIISVLVIIAIAFSSCDKNEMIKAQIKKKKGQIVKLNKQIAKLEEQLTDTNDVVKSIPVNVKQMNGENFKHYIIVFGEVEAENYALINPEMGGHVKKIYVEEGDFVESGKLLVSLNTDALNNSIKQIKTNFELAAETYEKQKKLWSNNVGSEIQYKQAKTTKESLESQLKTLQAQKEMSEIRAPFSGYVNKIYPKAGELAAPGMPVVEVVNLKKLSVTADVSEIYLSKIKKGQMVDVSFASYPELKMSTPIVRVSKMINDLNRTFEIEIKLNNNEEKIKPNMISQITINDFSSDNAFVLPSLIIKQDISGKYVYTIKEEKGRFIVSKTYVKTGLSYEDQTMIVEGISINDKVVTDGYNLVSSGVPVEIKN